MFLIYKNGIQILNSIIKNLFVVLIFIVLINNKIISFDKSNKINNTNENVKNFIRKLKSCKRFRKPK